MSKKTIKIYNRIILVVLILGLSGFFINVTNARTYPIKEIIKKNCDMSDISSCHYPLPIIKDAEYKNYKLNPVYRQVYTVLWGSNYKETWNVGIGSHQGVDIATAQGTWVYAIGDGKVIEAGYKGNWGFVITIEHDINGKKIYSTYAHLSLIGIKKGDYVKEGEIIAQVGTTGNSTGPHLHFQIEINQDNNHPFFYTNCAGEISEIINLGLCQNQMYLSTLDPILFLEKNGVVNLAINENNLTNSIFGFEDLVISGFVGGNLDSSQIQTIDFSVKNLEAGDIAIVSGTVKIVSDPNFIQVLPSSFEVVYGTKKIFLIPKKTGSTTIQIYYGDKLKRIVPVFLNPVVTKPLRQPTADISPLSAGNPVFGNAKIIVVRNKDVLDGYYGIFKYGDLGSFETGGVGVSVMADVNTKVVSVRDGKQNLKSRISNNVATGSNILKIQKNPEKKAGFIVFKFKTTNLSSLKIYVLKGSEVVGSN